MTLTFETVYLSYADMMDRQTTNIFKLNGKKISEEEAREILKKQKQERIMNYEKVLELACKEITERLTELCPSCRRNPSGIFFSNTCSEEEAAKCWKKYFLEKAESEAENDA